VDQLVGQKEQQLNRLLGKVAVITGGSSGMGFATAQQPSRRRPGVLHQPGTMPAPEQLRADVDRLYREALQQDQGKQPFAIFLDVNLPPNTTPDAVAAWQSEIVTRWQSNERIASGLHEFRLALQRRLALQASRIPPPRPSQIRATACERRDDQVPSSRVRYLRRVRERVLISRHVDFG
jgi:hypothetical protein